MSSHRFSSPTGSQINDIEITARDGAAVNQGLMVDLARPKNAVIILDETRYRLVPR